MIYFVFYMAISFVIFLFLFLLSTSDRGNIEVEAPLFKGKFTNLFFVCLLWPLFPLFGEIEIKKKD